MAGLTQTWRNEIFNDVVLDATIYFGLLDQTETEVAGGSYARQAITFGAISADLLANSAEILLTPPAVAVYYAALFDAVSAGNKLHSVLLGLPRTFNGTTPFRVPVGDLVLDLDP